MSKENNENLVIEPFFNTIEVCNNLNNMMYYGDIYAVYCINCAVSENNNVHLYVNELAEFKFKEDAEYYVEINSSKFKNLIYIIKQIKIK